MADNVVLLGSGRAFETMPEATFRDHVRRIPVRSHRRDFMTADHDAVREFAVRELGRTGAAVPLERIAHGAGLAIARADEVIAELERRLLFLVCDADRSVVWAFPITSERTAHLLRYENRPPTYAA